MRSRTLKTTLVAVFTSALILVPGMQAQTLDQRMAVSEKLSVPIAGTVLPPADGHTDLKAETLKAQAVGLVNSLTDNQRAQIRAVLDANMPSMREAGNTRGTPNPATDAQRSLEALQALNQAEQGRTDTINAGIRSTLTAEQAAIFDATLLSPPQEEVARLDLQLPSAVTSTLNDCYYAYYYNYYYNYSYSYYAYLYAYYNYYYYSGSDAIASQVYSLAYNLYYVYAYNAYLYSYYAYYSSRSTYSRSAWYYSDYAQETAYAVYYLAYRLSYYWAPNSYAYNAYYYGYNSYYYSYYYSNAYAYGCAH